MTAAQRRTVTVKIGGDGHRVEVTADVQDPAELIKLAMDAYHDTNSTPPRAGIGFESQHVERPYARIPLALRGKEVTHD